MPSRTTVFRDAFEDSYLNESTPTNTYGTGAFMIAGYQTGKATGEYRPWMRVDLVNDTPQSGRNLVAGATILAAVIELECYSVSGMGGYPATWRGIIDTSVVESSISWQHPFGASAVNWDGANESLVAQGASTLEIPNSTGTHTWVLTSLLQWAMTERAGDLNMVLTFDASPGSSATANYRSSDYAIDTSKRPKLTVIWEPPIDNNDAADGPLVNPQSHLRSLTGGRLVG